MTLEAKGSHQNNLVTASVPSSDCQPLRECLRTRLAGYFADLDGHPAGDLYQLVIAEVEVPLFEMALDYTAGNLSRAAEVLGINRATLRGKLKHYGLNGF
ncbi:MAG: helix-turn-helix domain-containing protein [Gammaproteobacteria bacterium]